MARAEFSRACMLLGDDALEALEHSSVTIVGIGGVGSYAAEAVARGGVGKITLIDGDSVSISNINRQLVALHSTLGKNKAEVMRRRILDINPLCDVTAVTDFYSNGTEMLNQPDFLIDAIDNVTNKLDLIESCFKSGIAMISAMGTGNKLDPSQFETGDIFSTSVCPLCRVIRRELKKRGVTSLNVVYSREIPLNHGGACGQSPRTPGSVSFVPPAAGLLLAGQALKALTGLAGYTTCRPPQKDTR